MSLRLTDKFLGGEKGPSKGAMPKGRKAQVDHWDTSAPGLGVRVTKGGRRSFVIWYRFNGKPRRDTLKPQYPALSLEDARKEANQTAVDVAKNPPQDPRLSGRDFRKASKHSDHADIPGTFAKAVAEYVRRYQVAEAENKTAGEVERALLKFGEEWKGPVSDITARDIRTRLEAIRDGGEDRAPAPYMANRLFSYLRKFFSWCTEAGIEYCETSPMVKLRKPKMYEAEREIDYSEDQIAAIWKAADKEESPYAKAFVKLLVLTGKRKGAIAAMRWNEIIEKEIGEEGRKRKVPYWEPPQPPRKRGNKRLHSIPLPPLANQIIRALPKVERNEFVFPGKKDGKHFVPGTSLQTSIKDESGVDDFMFHGLRHTMETKLAGMKVLPHLRAVVLDHAPTTGSGSKYDHHDYDEFKAEVLEAWADRVQGILVKKKVWGKGVIPMAG